MENAPYEGDDRRSGDGVHFTDEGAGRIAAAVWAAMKRDWLPAE